MIRVNVIAVGSLKESWLKQAQTEYSKRLGGYCTPCVVEINECRLKENPSQKSKAAALAKEAQSFEKYLQIKGAYSIALCIEGRCLSSEQLSQKIEQTGVNGFSTLNFFIGSSYGLDEEFKRRCDFSLSMSPMTFPHQLARIMLLEQLYRAFSISANAKYHK
ncbi:MAG: 23S rRNA (pseudouridine(1915)-N(3))-methyltransferase RlmH [Ruminococcus sp.]|nr:23S rRNA (pseudouridine(1915)-N(3))-methyltransferase RlmH [Ruminococcus sp.]